MGILDAPSGAVRGVSGITGDTLGGVSNFISNPFSIFDRRINLRPDPDFPEGFRFVEIVNGVPQNQEQVALLGTWMPKQPFEFGGGLRFTKEYYPGRSEPVFHILGPEETDLVVRGTLNDKNLKFQKRGVAQEVQQLIDAMRIRGNLVQLTLGEFRRYGFLTNCAFKMRTIGDIDYELTFSLVGFNKPLNCNQIKTKNDVPLKINKKLIAQATAFQSTYTNIPSSVPLSIADALNLFVSDVIGVVAQVTGFVDSVITTVESLANSVNRVTALARYAEAELSRLRWRIGRFRVNDFAGRNMVSRYTNMAFTQDAISATNDLSSFLRELREQFEALSQTTPLARYRVQIGDTLQSIAVKFYGDALNWEKIYDHNNLTTTDLSDSSVPAILEIPRL